MGYAPRGDRGGYTFLTTPFKGMVSDKSYVAAGVLGILLGAFGVHRFYLGYIGVGFAYLGGFLGGLALSWFILPALLAIAISILTFIEGILLLTETFRTDANGAELPR